MVAVKVIVDARNRSPWRSRPIHDPVGTRADESCLRATAGGHARTGTRTWDADSRTRTRALTDG
jgi:hypothetical protein